MSTAIEFNHVGKQYRLGLVGTGTLSHDLNRWWQTSVLHREDPYLKIGDVNDRAAKATSDYIWALRDIDFKVEQGDVVGIIGKNGAGKSTLLKLLSRVTAPTVGTINARGRIASLLEVGTGFHSEMTGRENIYMNGAILGMTKQEISAKLDEIIAFSGCEKYIDTPVKRYSSGMTVRLGFAVAAFLEPEILVVDEVLAVGDAEFQKKAIGKMQDVASGGRTVLFVSHNMGSIRQLCNSCVLLDNGMVKEIGDTEHIISSYLTCNFKDNSERMDDINVQDAFRILNFTIKQHGVETDHLTQGDSYNVEFDVLSLIDQDANFVTNIEVKSENTDSVTCFGNEFQNYPSIIPARKKVHVEIKVAENLLKDGTYFFSPYFSFFYNHGISNPTAYVEYGKKFYVENASQLYVTNPHRPWLIFPHIAEHGYLPTKLADFSYLVIE